MQVQCPSCSKQLNVPDTAAGKKAKCPGCTTVFQIPPTTSVAATPAVPKPPPPVPRAMADDDEDDKPVRRRRTRSEEDDDEDEPRSRAHRYDEDEEEDDGDYERPIRRSTATRSGRVTALGIITIVWGSLSVLGGLCITFGGIFFAAAVPNLNQMNPRGAPPMPAGMGALVGGIALVMGAAILLFGIGAIFAGIGVLKRRGWGRILTFVYAGFVAVAALFTLFGMVAGNNQNFFGSLTTVVLQVAYVAFAFSVLLDKRAAAEFR